MADLITMSPCHRIFACILLGLSLPAQGENLLEIYQQAQEHDARWAAAQYAYSAGSEKLAQGRAALLPTLNLSGSKTYYDSSIVYQTSTPFVGGQRNYDSLEYGASLTQPLYRKQNIALYMQSRAQIGMAEAQLAAARSELILRVAQAYFDALLADHTAMLADAQKNAYREERDQAEGRFKGGAVAITDVYEAQSRLDLSVSQELAARNDLEIKKEAIRRITGKMPDSLVPFQRELDAQPPSPNDIEHWVATADENNPQIRTQRRNLEVAEREVEKARGGHYPTIDAVAAYTVTTATGSTYVNTESDIKSKSVGVQVQMPLFQGGAICSHEREAVALREKAREELEDTRRAIAVQTRQAFLETQNAIAQIGALKQALISSESQLQSTHAGLTAGLRTNVDVLNAQQQLFNVKRDLARAYYTYLLGTLHLQDSAGLLSSQHLEKVNSLLGQEQSSSRNTTSPLDAQSAGLGSVQQ